MWQRCVELICSTWPVVLLLYAAFRVITKTQTHRGKTCLPAGPLRRRFTITLITTLFIITKTFAKLLENALTHISIFNSRCHESSLFQVYREKEKREASKWRSKGIPFPTPSLVWLIFVLYAFTSLDL